ncbi:MAG: hypothetical protein AB8G22_16660 [Saprospiraceae bacterium]
MEQALDMIYALEKAIIINEKIIRERVYREEKYNISEGINQWKAIKKNLTHNALDLYQMRFSHEKNNLLENYKDLRDSFFETFDNLNHKDRKINLLSLLNDCFRLIKAKVLKIDATLELYKFGIQNNLLLSRGKITVHQFVTIIMASNYKGDFEYSKFFLANYTDKLNQNIQHDANAWATAHIFYWMEDLDKSLDILINHSFTLQFFQQISKALTTQIYFDMYLKDDSYETLLYNHLNAFEKWITREKVRSKILKSSFLRFIQLTRRIAKYHSDPNTQVNKVSKILETENNIQAAEWLRSKLNFIIKHRGRNN